VKNGLISQVSPGVFFYWVAFTPTSDGQTFTVTQSGFDSHYFTQASGSFVYDSSCNKIDGSSLISTSGAVTTATFGSVAGTTYYIGIKYNAGSIVGASPPSGGTATILFHGSVPGSDSSIALVPKHP
jgi:hypothetical protein